MELGSQRAARAYPIKVVVADVEAPPEISADRADGGRYRGALIFLLNGRQPVGRIEITLDQGTISSSSVRELFRQGLPAPGTAPTRKDLFESVADLPFASVVIPTICNRVDELARCIEALDKQDYPDFEIVIVDNRRPNLDHRGELPSAIRDVSRVRIVTEDVPGIAAAKNRGVLSAKGEVVAFTDDDIIVDEAWLRELVSPLVCDATLGVVTGLVLPMELETAPQGWFEEYAGGFGHGFDPLVYVPVHRSRRGHRSRVRRVQCIDASGVVREDLSLYSAAVRGASGGSSASWKSLLQSLGAFDVNLGTGTPTGGGEDLAFSAKVFTAGRSVRYEPRAISFHAHRRTYPELARQVRAWGSGLVAMLTSLVCADPGQVVGIMARVPSAMNRVLRRSELRREAGSLPSGFPARLRWYELSGMGLGGPAYVISRVNNWRRRPRARQFAAPRTGQQGVETENDG